MDQPPMTMTWDALTACYGSELEKHRAKFDEAGQTTYALLCCRFTRSNDRLAASSGDHAEARLLVTGLWLQEVPGALQARTYEDAGIFLVTLAVNRTPCPGCTEKLIRALGQLHDRYPARMERARFLLACRGAYRGQPGEDGRYDDATTIGGLNRLQRAGWELCVLRVGESLPPSGQELLYAVKALGRDEVGTAVLTL